MMPFEAFLGVLLVLAILAWIGFSIAYKKTKHLSTIGREGNVRAGVRVPLCILAIVLSFVTVMLTGTYAFARNDENVDRKFCETVLTERGHTTKFFVYNTFNHECYLRVDGQWLELNDTNFGKQ